jgi:hypothetical protein
MHDQNCSAVQQYNAYSQLGHGFRHSPYFAMYQLYAL